MMLMYVEKTTLLLNQTTPHTTKSADLIAHQQTVDDWVGFWPCLQRLAEKINYHIEKVRPYITQRMTVL